MMPRERVRRKHADQEEGQAGELAEPNAHDPGDLLGPAPNPLLAHDFSLVQVQNDGSSAAGAPWSPPLTQRRRNDLFPGSAQLAAALAQGSEPARRWLQDHTDQLQGLSIAGITERMRRVLPEARGLSDGEIAQLIEEWAAAQGLSLPRVSLFPGAAEAAALAPPGAGPSLPDSELIDAVQRAFSIANNGANLERPHGLIKLTIGGPTVELYTGGVTMGGKMSWDGHYGVYGSYGGVHFGADIDAKRWSVELTLGDNPSDVDPAKLTEVFGKAEAALREIAATASRQHSLLSTETLSQVTKAQIDAIKNAVSALASAAKRRPQVNLNITLSGPGPGARPDQAGPKPPEPGAEPQPGGVTIKANVLIRF